MYLVIMEVYGCDPLNLAVTYTLEDAKGYIDREEGVHIPDSEYTQENERLIYCYGDEQYAIQEITLFTLDDEQAARDES